MQSIDNESQIITDKSDLTKIFYSGCKNTEKIGVESEKLLVYKDNYKAVTYEDIVKVLSGFNENTYKKYYENGNLIGLKSDFGSVSLEPGSQVEISLIPYKNISEITSKLLSFYNELTENAEKIGAVVLNSGIQPVSTYENIKIIPKKRYEYMTKYLPKKGTEPFIMMRETAGIQANFDYKTEEDAIKKLSLSLKMSGIIASVYANSPVRNGKYTEYKSFRTESWRRVDETRCGLIDKRLFDKKTDFTFEDYTDILLNIPMIFILRGNNCFETEITFGEFLNNGYNGLKPTVSDWENHISLYFPDVRLKSYVEIRNHDAQNAPMTFSVPAFWKGILYNKNASEEIENILEEYTYEDFIQLRKDVPKYAVNAKLKNMPVYDFVKKFFEISYASLKESKTGEEKYLEPVFEYIKTGQVPADNILYNFDNNRQ